MERYLEWVCNNREACGLAGCGAEREAMAHIVDIHVSPLCSAAGAGVLEAAWLPLIVFQSMTP